MTKKTSKKLQKAIDDIELILKKNDIMGMVSLADGESHGEFANFVQNASWSMIEFKDNHDGSMTAHLKAHVKSKPKESNMTVNALIILQDMIAYQFSVLYEIISNAKEKISIVEDEGEWGKND